MPPNSKLVEMDDVAKPDVAEVLVEPIKAMTHATTEAIIAAKQAAPRVVDDESTRLLRAKRVVGDFHDALERRVVDADALPVLREFVDAARFTFRSVHPFRDHLTGLERVAGAFYGPLLRSFSCLQRRADVFFGGRNLLHAGETSEDDDDDDTFWVLSMGHFVGLYDEPWLGIPATRKMESLRYSEFTQVCGATDKILKTALFLDVVGLMQDVGLHPLPPSTGKYYMYPGPRGHDGLWMDRNAEPDQAMKTQDLVDRMVDDLVSINHRNDGCPPDLLRKTWHESMIWYGPAGIGATYTIPRYQEQHQLPFRLQLHDKVFCGHEVRVAEGSLAAFFGWPCNLTNRNSGGFLGMPASDVEAPMQVVDVYRRDGDKLAENWVFIDIPHYLKAQGLDVIERTVGIANPNWNPVVRKDE